MVLCPHCNSDMTFDKTEVSEHCDTYTYEECIYICPLCHDLYRMTEKFVLLDRELEKME